MHIAHQIRMNGAPPDFDDQMDIIPWLDPHGPALAISDDLDRKQPAEPRVFKSHSPYKAFTNPKSGLSKGGKLIYCFRDQCDVCVSSWRFLAPMFGFTSDEIPLDAWAGGHFGPSGAKRGLNHLCDWWEARHDPRVLFLFFEEMRANHEATVRKVAAFMGREDMDAATLEKVVATTTHKSMSSPEHHHRFDDHRIAKVFAEINGLSWPRELTGKVRKDGGKSGEGAQRLSPEHRAGFAEAWKAVVTRRLGFKDLAEMRAAWRAEQGG